MHTPVEHSSLFSYSPFRSKHVPRRPVKLKTLETTANQQAVPSDNKFSDVELRLDEVAINSDVKISSFKKQEWCKITRNPDLSSATLQNKSLNVIFVDGTDVPSEDTIMIRCGSEIIPGPVSEESLIAAGAGLSLVDSVVLASKISKNPPFGFALIRTPGHHALPKGPMGFCVKMVAFRSF
ncbi:hypothetical protein L2E82_20628 [Cichorium intybus]|uniref:Uncharacterized protein n=1 Tax=Cichorium intybus TaxID=13427 RepID=A0ACB9DTL9_CICIN|nr:hypothetical protein L2E82_20628 [Cichorium intybus]